MQLPLCFDALIISSSQKFCNPFYERAPSLSEITLRLFPFICVVTPNCHRFFPDFLQFRCIFRHSPLIPIGFICFYRHFSDFAAVWIKPCIFFVFCGQSPIRFRKNADFRPFRQEFFFWVVHKLFYFHSNPCHSPRIY